MQLWIIKYNKITIFDKFVEKIIIKKKVYIKELYIMIYVYKYYTIY